VSDNLLKREKASIMLRKPAKICRRGSRQPLSLAIFVVAVLCSSWCFSRHDGASSCPLPAASAAHRTRGGGAVRERRRALHSLPQSHRLLSLGLRGGGEANAYVAVHSPSSGGGGEGCERQVQQAVQALHVLHDPQVALSAAIAMPTTTTSPPAAAMLLCFYCTYILSPPWPNRLRKI